MRIVLLLLSSLWPSTSVSVLASESFNRTPSSITQIIYCGKVIAESGIHDVTVYAGSLGFIAEHQSTVNYVKANAEITVTYTFCNAELIVNVSR